MWKCLLTEQGYYEGTELLLCYKLGEPYYATSVHKALAVDDIYSESENESDPVAGCSRVDTKKRLYSPGDFVLIKLSVR